MTQIPFGGQWSAFLGEDNDETSRLSQVVSITANQYYLHFQYYIGSRDVCGFDFAHFKVNNATLLTFDLCANNETSGWLHQMVDLSVYVGTNATLLFEVTTDSSEVSSFYLDDVSLTSSTTAPPQGESPAETCSECDLPKSEVPIS